MADIFDQISPPDIFDEVESASFNRPGSIPAALGIDPQFQRDFATQQATQEIAWRNRGTKLVPMPQPDGTTDWVRVDAAQPPAPLNDSERLAIFQAYQADAAGTGIQQPAEYDAAQAGQAVTGMQLPGLKQGYRIARNVPGFREAEGAFLGNEALQDFGGSLGQGLGQIGTGMIAPALRPLAPDVAPALAEGVQQGYAYNPDSKMAFAGSVAANVAPLLPALAAGPGGAAAYANATSGLLGLSTAGNVMNDVAQRRASGEQISVQDELTAAAMAAAAEFAGERVGLGAMQRGAGRLVAERLMQKVRRKVAEYTVAAGVNAPEELITAVAQNAVQQRFIDPTQDITEGAGEAALAGGLVGVAGRGAGDLMKRRPQAKPPAQPSFTGPTEAATDAEVNDLLAAADALPDASPAPAKGVTPAPDPAEFQDAVFEGAAPVDDAEALALREKSERREANTPYKDAEIVDRFEAMNVAKNRAAVLESPVYVTKTEAGFKLDQRQPTSGRTLMVAPDGKVSSLEDMKPRRAARDTGRRTGEASAYPEELTNAKAVGEWYGKQFNDAGNAAVIESLAGIEGFDTKYVLRDVPVDQIEANDLTEGDTNAGKVATFQKRDAATQPPIIAVGTKALSVADGGHRLAAAKARGDKTIKAYVPAKYADAKLPKTTPGLDAEIDAALAESDAKQAAGKPLPKRATLTTRRYTLSDFADTMHSEQSAENVVRMLDEQGTGPGVNDTLWVSNDADMATGQGNNTGVKLEFAGADLEGVLNTSKPGWEFTYDQGSAEFMADAKGVAGYRKAVRKITIDPKAIGSDRMAGRLQNVVIPSLLKQGWTATKNADGTTTYTAGKTKPVTPAATTTVKTKGTDETKAATVAKATAAAAPPARVSISKAVAVDGSDHKSHLPPTIEQFITPLSSRIRDISQRVFDRLMRMEFNTGVTRETLKRDLLPKAQAITKALGGPESKTYKQFKLAVLNRDFAAAKAVLPAEAHKDFAAFETTFANMLAQQRDAGVKIGELTDYWPRFIRDYKSFDAIFGDDMGRFEEAWDLAHKVKGKPLTAEEKVEIANNVIQGFGPRKPGSYGPANARFRSIETLSEEQAEFYLDPMEAAFRYVDSAAYATERSRFLGRNHDLSKLQETVGQIVQQEVDAGHVSKDRQQELNHLLQVRFTADMMMLSKTARNAKQIMYLTSLGQFRSAINQTLDFAVTATSHGLASAAKGAKAALHLTPADKRIVMESIGIHDHGEEFRDVGKVARATDRILKITGFKLIDRIGKESRINAARNSFANAAKNPQSEAFKRLKREYGPVLGEQFDATMDDLRAGKTTENVRYLLFLDVAKVQPIALSQMPEKYLKADYGRLFYAMKTFTIQQLDFVRRDIVRKLAKPGQRREGLETLGAFVLLVTLMGVGKDIVQDLIRGKEINPDQLSDRALESMLGTLGLSRYTIDQGWQKPSDAAKNLIFPPLSWVDKPWQDIRSFGDGNGFRSIQLLPVIGDLLYYHAPFGAGGRLSADQAKTDYRAKLRELREEAYLARMAGDESTARDLLAIYNERRLEGPGDGRKTKLTYEDLRKAPPGSADAKAASAARKAEKEEGEKQ